MLYSLLTDLVVAVHIGYVAYIIVGLALILVGLGRKWGWVRNPWFRLTHLAAILREGSAATPLTFTAGGHIVAAHYSRWRALSPDSRPLPPCEATHE